MPEKSVLLERIGDSDRGHSVARNEHQDQGPDERMFPDQSTEDIYEHQRANVESTRCVPAHRPWLSAVRHFLFGMLHEQNRDSNAICHSVTLQIVRL